MARYRQERPKPVGTIVGVVLCLGAIGVFLVLVSTDVIKFEKKPPAPPRRAGGTGPAPAPAPAPGRGTSPTADPGTTTPTAPETASGEVVVAFTGSFSEKGDTRKVVYRCPHCGKEIVDVRVPKCPSCARNLKWPTKVRCGFCAGSGECKFCKGTGKCPVCNKGRPMLMGVKPPCEACNTTGKCPACNGTKVCTFCERGVFFPGKPKAPEKPSSQPPPPIPKPQPE